MQQSVPNVKTVVKTFQISPPSSTGEAKARGNFVKEGLCRRTTLFTADWICLYTSSGVVIVQTWQRRTSTWSVVICYAQQFRSDLAVIQNKYVYFLIFSEAKYDQMMVCLIIIHLLHNRGGGLFVVGDHRQWFLLEGVETLLDGVGIVISSPAWFATGHEPFQKHILGCMQIQDQRWSLHLIRSM